jgi:USP6 N-terminal-like protein
MQVRKRIYKGIPDALRGCVWSRLLEIDRIKAEQVGVYEVSVSSSQVDCQHIVIPFHF